MAEICGIGANCFDTLFSLDRFPEEDTKQKAVAVREAGGGPVATGLCAAAKLGASCAFIGTLADDNAGRFLRADLEARGVDTALVGEAPGASSFVTAVLLSRESGSRTCLFHRGTVPPTRLGEREKEAIRRAGVLMVDGNDLDAAVEGAVAARAAGTAVLYDAGGLYEGVERLLPLADLLIPSEEFALKHTGKADAEEAARDLFARYSPQWVVITRGKKGGVFFDGKTLGSYPIYPAEVVDSNGSGDVFHGAFAFAYLRGFSLEDCCRFSSAVSALKCTRVGARDAVPTPEELRAYLAAHSVPVRF